MGKTTKPSPKFSVHVPHTMTKFTIENTSYRARPHRVIVWGEYKGETFPIAQILMTTDELKHVQQTIKNRLGENE